MIIRLGCGRRALTPELELKTSSSPLTPSNDAHLQSDSLNLTRLLEHYGRSVCPLFSFNVTLPWRSGQFFFFFLFPQMRFSLNSSLCWHTAEKPCCLGILYCMISCVAFRGNVALKCCVTTKEPCVSNEHGKETFIKVICSQSLRAALKQLLWFGQLQNYWCARTTLRAETKKCAQILNVHTRKLMSRRARPENFDHGCGFSTYCAPRHCDTFCFSLSRSRGSIPMKACVQMHNS